MLKNGLCLLTLLAAAPVFAQTSSATVQGFVNDPAGGLMPNAEVTLTQLQTAVTQKTKTNGAGFCVFPASPIGAYKVTVTAPGMGTWKGQVVLQASLVAEINVALKVGATSAQITVFDVTPTADTAAPTISERLDRSQWTARLNW